MAIRVASLDDTEAISRLFRGRIGVWQRLDAHGRVEDVPYEALTLLERWVHGGAWMSVETAAVFLNHLLLGAGIPLVAVDDSGKRILGYAEAYHSQEAEPFGSSLHIEHLMVTHEDVSIALLTALLERAKVLRARVTVNRVTDDYTLPDGYTLKTLSLLRRYTVAARQGQVFYRSVEQADANPAQISGWMMPVGRFTSARHQWETHMARLWEAFPRGRSLHRQKLAAAGQDSFVVIEQEQYDPRAATVYTWAAKPVTPQTITAIRDWAHREGYRTLILAMTDEAAKVLGAEADADAFTQETCALVPVPVS
ncbi:MAG: hypothetical protein IAE80_05510 [Anaerolinea sp.]|nr:hypothetical protein [Anaerolinea sp.]